MREVVLVHLFRDDVHSLRIQFRHASKQFTAQFEQLLRHLRVQAISRCSYLGTSGHSIGLVLEYSVKLIYLLLLRLHVCKSIADLVRCLNVILDLLHYRLYILP